jgi:hypothetical protein
LMPDGKVALVVETNGPIDLQRVVALALDACIFNLGSRDTLIKVLELAFTDQRVFVFGKSIASACERCPNHAVVTGARGPVLFGAG